MDTDPTDGPGHGGFGLCHPVCLWQFCAYLANLHADERANPTYHKSWNGDAGPGASAHLNPT